MRYLSNMPSTTSAQSSMAQDRKPDNLTAWRAFKVYVYNNETKTCCNRTPKNWTILLTFYILFTSTIFGLFLALLFGVVDQIRKSYKHDPWFAKLLVQEYANPGLSFVPNIVRNIPSPIIWYTFQGEQHYNNMKPEAYIEYIDGFLKKYDDAELEYINNVQSYYKICNETNRHKLGGKRCLFAKSFLGECGKDDYGYLKKKPCFYLKVNKLPNWEPDAYDAHHLHPKMPETLKRVIARSGVDKKLIWVVCHGSTPMDTEILGEVSYFPDQGFPVYYYPVLRSKEYLVPLVAVRLNNLREGYLVTILCTMFAKNIRHGERNDQVKLSFYVDKY